MKISKRHRLKFCSVVFVSLSNIIQLCIFTHLSTHLDIVAMSRKKCLLGSVDTYRIKFLYTMKLTNISPSSSRIDHSGNYFGGVSVNLVLPVCTPPL